MKILVEASKQYCGAHSIAETGTFSQLVVFDCCHMCNPTSSNFVGVETHEPIDCAVVMDRPDLDERTYELIIRASLKSLLHFQPDEKSRLKEVAKLVSAQLLDVSTSYDPGTLVQRTNGWFYTDRRRIAG